VELGAIKTTPLEAQGRSLERGRRDGTGTKRERRETADLL